jgi:hypothetical protein
MAMKILGAFCGATENERIFVFSFFAVHPFFLLFNNEYTELSLDVKGFSNVVVEK